MGLYSDIIFPHLCDWGMSSPKLAELRGKQLADARGKVLEIGAGTGLNLEHYGEDVERLVLIDPNPGMHRILRKRLEQTRLPVEKQVGRAEALPFPDHSFDYVVSTFVLCSIPDLAGAMKEIHRVLRPGGKFLFLEHGQAPDARVRRWQKRLNPIQRRLGDGCRLDVDIPSVVESVPFDIPFCEQSYFPGAPKFLGYIYRGQAVKTPSDHEPDDR